MFLSFLASSCPLGTVYLMCLCVCLRAWTHLLVRWIIESLHCNFWWEVVWAWMAQTLYRISHSSTIKYTLLAFQSSATFTSSSSQFHFVWACHEFSASQNRLAVCTYIFSFTFAVDFVSFASQHHATCPNFYVHIIKQMDTQHSHLIKIGWWLSLFFRFVCLSLLFSFSQSCVVSFS